jgi:CDP-glucose 4,6-dehydratase
MAELAIRTYADSFFNNPGSKVRIGITRAGNVIGGGDWALDRIVPDCVNAWSIDKNVSIRNPLATRPWQHVLEPLSGYLVLGAELSVNSKLNGEAYNFGPNSNQNHSVSRLIEEMAKHWEKVRWSDLSNKNETFHEAGLLKLNCDKALFDLKWQPTLDFEGTVLMTIEWYKEYYQNTEGDMHDFTASQIYSYINCAKNNTVHWANDD